LRENLLKEHSEPDIVSYDRVCCMWNVLHKILFFVNSVCVEDLNVLRAECILLLLGFLFRVKCGNYFPTDTCPLGQELGVSEECIFCPKGTYRDIDMTACTTCPYGYTTERDGSPAVDYCTLGRSPFFTMAITS